MAPRDPEAPRVPGRAGAGRRRAGAAVAGLAAAALALVSACTAESGSAGRVGSASPAASPAPARGRDSRPASIAALGDSITRGFGACGALRDCPRQAWPALLGTRLSARVWNLAGSGARMTDLAGQAERAVARRPDQVVILMGANDACRDTVEEMTPVAEYRRQFAAAMDVLRARLPTARVLVASVPDLRRLLEVGRKAPLAKEIWRLGVCPSMLSAPDAVTAAAERRRSEVRARVVAYNAALGAVCARYRGCRTDAGAVFGYRFSAAELSPYDWFHPSATGQAQLARVIGQAGFGSAAAGEGR